jgi:CheY-like chemotaxis protein
VQATVPRQSARCASLVSEQSNPLQQRSVFEPSTHQELPRPLKIVGTFAASHGNGGQGVGHGAAEYSNSKRAQESSGGAGKPLASPSPAPPAPDALPSFAMRLLAHPNASAIVTNSRDQRETRATAATERDKIRELRDATQLAMSSWTEALTLRSASGKLPTCLMCDKSVGGGMCEGCASGREICRPGVEPLGGTLLAPKQPLMPRRRVLIVDDEQDMLDCVAEVLVQHFDLTLATSGPEALRALRVGEFDAVLLDLKMSGVDGFDVLNYLARFQPKTKVMIASGLPSLDRIAERYGASDWLAKPYHIDVLEKRVARLVGEEPRAH